MFIVDENKQMFDFAYNGKEYSIPAYKDLPLDDLKALNDEMQAADDKDAALLFGVLALIERNAKGSTKNISARQAAALVNAYVKGDELGEA